MADAGVEVFEAGICFNDRCGVQHRTDPAAHVAVADVVEQVGSDSHLFTPHGDDPGVAHVMDDVVADGAVGNADHTDPRHARLANPVVGLFFTPGSVVPVPGVLVVAAHAGDGESIERGILCHDNAGSVIRSPAAINDGAFSAFETERSLRVIASTSYDDARTELQTLSVRAAADHHRVTGSRRINCRLNRGLICGDAELRRDQGRGEGKQQPRGGASHKTGHESVLRGRQANARWSRRKASTSMGVGQAVLMRTKPGPAKPWPSEVPRPAASHAACGSATPDSRQSIQAR